MSAAGDGFAVHAIGHVHSSWPDRRSTPRQGAIVPSSVGVLRMVKRFHPQMTLQGLDKFSHLWLVWLFHNNTGAIKPSKTQHKLRIKTKIRPPRLNGKRTGIYSCRTPHRINPVGLTLCKILKIDLKKGELTLGGLDLISGTPVIDIKPYVPYCDAPTTAARVPAWIELPISPEIVTWTHSAAASLGSLSKELNHYPDSATAVNALSEAIANVPRSRRKFHRWLAEGDPAEAELPPLETKELRKVCALRLGALEVEYMVIVVENADEKDVDDSAEMTNSAERMYVVSAKLWQRSALASAEDSSSRRASAGSESKLTSLAPPAKRYKAANHSIGDNAGGSGGGGDGSMSHAYLKNSTLPKPVGSYPYARRVGDLLFLSGVGPRDPITDRVPGGDICGSDGQRRTDYDVYAQTKQCIDNVRAVLAGHGLTLDDLVDVQAFLVDMKRNFPAFNAIYSAEFRNVQKRPARTTIGVEGLPPGGRIAVEIKAVARFTAGAAVGAGAVDRPDAGEEQGATKR